MEAPQARSAAQCRAMEKAENDWKAKEWVKAKEEAKAATAVEEEEKRRVEACAEAKWRAGEQQELRRSKLGMVMSICIQMCIQTPPMTNTKSSSLPAQGTFELPATAWPAKKL